MAKALERFRNDEHSTLSVLIKGFNYEKVVRLEECNFPANSFLYPVSI